MSNLPNDQRAFAPLPARPKKPSGPILGLRATDKEAKDHFSRMLDYWISEAKWQEARANQLNVELSALLGAKK